MASEREQLQKQHLQVIEEYYDQGFWLIPLVPFTSKVGDILNTPNGKFRVKKERDIGKAPLHYDYNNKRCSKEILLKFFEPQPFCLYNLGVVLGADKGLICLDIDFKNGGNEFLEKYTEELERDGFWEHTGNGVHIYFLPPTWMGDVPSIGSGNFVKDGKKWPGVELKAHGTQVVTYPSIHASAKNGDGTKKQYKFEYNCILSDGELSELPESFFGDVLRARPKVKKRDPEKPRKQSDFREDAADIERAIKQIASIKAEEGQLNDTIYKVACIIRDFDIGPATCAKMLQTWAETNTSPQVPPEELRPIISNAYNYATGDAGAQSGAAMIEEAYQNASIEVPDAVVEELEEETGELDRKNPQASAIRFARLNPNLYCIEDYWFEYDDGTNEWSRFKESEFKVRLRRRYHRIAEGSTKENHFREFWLQFQAEIYARTKAISPVIDRWIGQDPKAEADFIKFKNGILDLRKGELLSHSPNYFTLTKLNFDYVAGATSPKFEDFLDSIWGHEKKSKAGKIRSQRDQLQRMLGYFISGSMSQHKFGLFIGVSRGGKGVLERIIRQFIGDENSMSTTLQLLGSPHGTTRLPGKKLLLLSDAKDPKNSNSETAMGVLQNMTGGDSITVNPKNRDDYDTQVNAKVLITTNRFPKWIDAQSAMYNRTLLFNFTITFAGRENRNLERELRGEIAGIFNFAYEGYRAWRADGVLDNCEQVKPLLGDMKRSMNPLSAFVEAACVVWKPKPEEEWAQDEGPWDFEEPPEDCFTARETLWEAYLRSQREENKKFTLTRQNFLTQVQHELFARGLKPEYWTEEKKRYITDQYGNKKRDRICRGLTLREFKTPEEFEGLFDLLEEDEK